MLREAWPAPETLREHPDYAVQRLFAGDDERRFDTLRRLGSQLTSKCLAVGIVLQLGSRLIAGVPEQLDQLDQASFVPGRQSNRTACPARRREEIARSLVSCGKGFGTLRREPPQSPSLQIEPLLELGSVREEEAVEEIASIQRQGMLQIASAERVLEFERVTPDEIRIQADGRLPGSLYHIFTN